jgi:hypothetical protein
MMMGQDALDGLTCTASSGSRRRWVGACTPSVVVVRWASAMLHVQLMLQVPLMLAAD